MKKKYKTSKLVTWVYPRSAAKQKCHIVPTMSCG